MALRFVFGQALAWRDLADPFRRQQGLLGVDRRHLLVGDPGIRSY
jgi:hypothetical protein